jgi:PAS domain S-box-containing protein
MQRAGSDIPFIIASGKIGEDTAVAAMKLGAHDYVMKDRLERLPTAVERELREATMRREHTRAEQQVRERVKELSAFFCLSGLAERRDLPLEVLYQETANMLPLSWQYPDVACARTVIDAREFRTANFAESPWMQVAEVRVDERVVGTLEIGYLVEKPAEDEGPFLKEERQTIDAIAERLGHITERKRAEEAARWRARWSQALLQLLQLSSTTETEIVAFAVETLVALTESKLCFIGFVDSSETTMSGHVWSQHAMQECAVLGGKPVQFEVARGGLWTAPIRQHRAIIVNDYAAANPLKKGCPTGHVPLTRFLGVPLIREGRTVLVAGLANKVEDYSAMDQSETTVFLEGLWGTLNRKRAEEALRESKELFAAFVRRSPIHAYIKAVTPTESRVLQASDSFIEMLGHAGEELLGKTMAELFPAELAAKITADDWAVASSGEVLKLDEDFNGRNYTSIKFPIVHRDMTLLAGFTIDITDRKRAQKTAALNTQRVEALLHLNQMTDATLHEITDFALEEAVRLTQSTIGYLAFLNEDESVLTMHSWSKAAMAECAIVDKPIVYPVASTGLWGEAVRQRRPVITNDYAAENPLRKGCPQGHVLVKRHMNVPVFDGTRIVLVIGVGNRSGKYEEGDSQQLTLLMEGMWRLLQHKRAEEVVLKKVEELRVSNEELDQFNRAMVGRELRMIELKEDINALCRRLGEPPRHAMDQLQTDSVPGAGPAPVPPGRGGYR